MTARTTARSITSDKVTTTLNTGKSRILQTFIFVKSSVGPISVVGLSMPGSNSEPITSRNPAATLTTIEIISFLQKDDTAVTRNVNISRNTSLNTNVITRAPKSVILNGHISNSCKAYIGAEKPSKP